MLIRCNFCSQALTRPGGLLFGPPDDEGKSLKQHLCFPCWDVVSVAMRPTKELLALRLATEVKGKP